MRSTLNIAGNEFKVIITNAIHHFTCSTYVTIQLAIGNKQLAKKAEPGALPIAYCLLPIVYWETS
jgi:hypothetical protein